MSETLSRRAFSALLASTAAAHAFLPEAHAQVPLRFAHPGLLHTRADLDRMHTAVQQRIQPIYAGYEKLRDHPASQLQYKSAGPSAEIGRNPNVRFGEFDRDANAAYQCALMNCITGDAAFARISIAILNDWAATLQRISGLDAVLCASLGGFKMVNAAELIRHNGTGWSTEPAERFGRMLTAVFLPVITNFAPFANGNWDTAAIKLMLSIAVYNDDRPLFDRAINYYLHGCGDGRLDHYIYPNGQCQESGRDQQHTQLGITHQGDCCEIAWNQGLDLYSALDNRLLQGFEYTARYELGEDVPFAPDVDQTGKYRHNVIAPRSPLRPGYEQIYNHYARRRGISTPWTQKAAESLRPEGAPFQADATGYGTLLYTRLPGMDASETAPLGAHPLLYAEWMGNAIQLDILPLSKAERYSILRAERPQGPYAPIVRDLTGQSHRDATTIGGRLYYYRAGLSTERQLSPPISQMAGLPDGWTQDRVGAGNASFDGAAFKLRAGGAQSIDSGGPYFLMHRSLPVKSVLTARLQPLIASQFLSLGIVVRNDNDPAQEQAFLILTPKGGNIEHPGWTISLLVRQNSGSARVIDSHPVATPIVVNGRIQGPWWLCMKRTGTSLTASFSSDGTGWQELARTNAPTGALTAGLFLISGIDTVQTEVVFDNVNISNT